MKGLVFIFKRLFSLLSSMRSILPKSFAGIFLISGFIINFQKSGWEYAITQLSLAILSAEQNIQKNVSLAVQKSSEYGLIQFFEILVSLFILWLLIKFFHNVFIGTMGVQAKWMSLVFATLLVGLIEYVAVVIVVGDFSFIPIWDGIMFLLLNLESVILNINWLHYSFNLGSVVAEEVVLNQTITNISI